MADEMSLAQAKQVFDTLCGMLDKQDWHYDKDEEKLTIESGVQGEDLPIGFNFQVDAERMVIMFLSHIPFVTPEDKRIDMAVAVTAVNNNIVDGCFDYDVASGHMFFRMTNSFIESLIAEDVFGYMLACSYHTIEEFNDQFLMIAKGMLSIEQFLEKVNN